MDEEDCIEFWSILDNAKVLVPLSECQIEIRETKKGIKKLLRVSFVGEDGRIRNLSKFVNKDFEL